MYIVQPSINNPNTHFLFNGLEYDKDHYTLAYRGLSIVGGQVDKTKVKVGIRSKFRLGEYLVTPVDIFYWSDGTSNFFNLDTLVSYLVPLLNFADGVFMTQDSEDLFVTQDNNYFFITQDQ